MFETSHPHDEDGLACTVSPTKMDWPVLSSTSSYTLPHPLPVPHCDVNVHLHVTCTTSSVGAVYNTVRVEVVREA